MEPQAKKLLVFNCHEAWVYQLGAMDYEIDIIDGLPGRYTFTWDTRMRPLPSNAHLVTLEEVLEDCKTYTCIITHNITDLMDVRSIPGPRILVIHSTFEMKTSKEDDVFGTRDVRSSLKEYIKAIGGHVVAVSRLKGNSWGFTEDIVPFSADIKEYFPWSGEITSGIRVANQIHGKKEVLLWEFHEKAFSGIPVLIVGYNPDMPGVFPASSWDELKYLLSKHRFFIHTAHPAFEDGYNMATLEAMAAGLPVLGNTHPSSPVEHGVNGFLSDDPDVLKKYAMLLLENHDLAREMGEKARETVSRLFPLELFVERFKKSIELAKQKWKKRTLPDSYFTSRSEEVQNKIIFLKTSRQLNETVLKFEEAIRLNNLEQAFEMLYILGEILNINIERQQLDIQVFLKLSEIIGNALIERKEWSLAQRLLTHAITVAAYIEKRN